MPYKTPPYPTFLWKALNILDMLFRNLGYNVDKNLPACDGQDEVMNLLEKSRDWGTKCHSKILKS